MTMSTADAIAWLRSGNYTENIMVQITHQPMIEEKAEWSCEFGAYYDYPILCDLDGVLRLSQRDFKGTDGRYYGVITRLTGVGSIYSGLLSGGPKAGAGSLDILIDDSPVIQEAKRLDWDRMQIEIRTGPNGTEWADGLELFSGIVADGKLKANGTKLSFRLTGNEWRLDETFAPEDMTNQGVTSHGDFTRFPIGYCPRVPITTIGVTNSGDYIYYPSGWSSADTISHTMYDGDEEDPFHTDIGETVRMNMSSGWTLNGDLTQMPVNYVFASVKGCDVGGFVYKPAEIISKALSFCRTRDEDGTVVTPLVGLTVNTASFTAYDTNTGYQMGYLFDYLKTGHENNELGQQLTGGVSAPSWRPAFEHLIGGSGGLWCFNRKGELCVHFLLKAPTATELLTLNQNGDYARAGTDWQEVERYRYVKTNSKWTFPNNNWDTIKYSGVTLYEADLYGYKKLEVENTITNTTQMQTHADTLKNRFGTRDYTLAGCLLAKVLSVGDTIKVYDPADEFLSTARKGFVIGVDAGTKPFVKVRV